MREEKSVSSGKRTRDQRGERLLSLLLNEQFENCIWYYTKRRHREEHRTHKAKHRSENTRTKVIKE